MTSLKKPPGYSIHISGSGLFLVLKYHGEQIDSWPAACNAREHLTKRAQKHHERETARQRKEAVGA